MPLSEFLIITPILIALYAFAESLQKASKPHFPDPYLDVLDGEGK